MEKLSKFWELSRGNAGAFALSIIMMLIIIGIAVIAEIILKKKGLYKKVSSTKKITIIGMFSALAAILMYLEVPLQISHEYFL